MKKYSKFYDFYSSDYVIIKNWFSTLKFFCISEGFNGYYDKLESLGKGHFAQVKSSNFINFIHNSFNIPRFLK